MLSDEGSENKLKEFFVAASRILIGQFIKSFSLRTVDIFRVRYVFYCSSKASHVLAGSHSGLVFNRISQDAHLAFFLVSLYRK